MSEFESTEVTTIDRNLDRDLQDVPPAGSGARAPREGLPTSYRMRAEPHYVDQLTARRSERAAVQVDSIDAREPVAGDRDTERVLALLQEEIASLTAAVGMVSADGSQLARRLGLDVIRAQAWRASWLVRAHSVIAGRERGVFRSKPLASILEQVRHGLAPECRLGGVGLKIQATDWNAVVSVDEGALLTGLTGAVLATFGVIGQTEGATVRVHVDAVASELRTVEVTQDDVAAPPALALRAFDGTWAERPGGSMAGLGALAARAAAQAHGGTATLVAGERRGTVLRMGFVRSH